MFDMAQIVWFKKVINFQRKKYQEQEKPLLTRYNIFEFHFFFPKMIFLRLRQQTSAQDEENEEQLLI